MSVGSINAHLLPNPPKEIGLIQKWLRITIVTVKGKPTKIRSLDKILLTNKRGYSENSIKKNVKKERNLKLRLRKRLTGL